MTSTSVKDVSSLMNFVGSRATTATGIGTGSTGSFGDVMSKASYSNTASANQSKAESSTGNSLSKSRVNQTNSQKTVLKTSDSSQTVKANDTSTSVQEQAVAEAGNEMVRETAKELGLSEEEVVDAMEELGFGVEALLNADNLTMLVLALSGEENSVALLTDEGLYGTMQNLLEDLDGIKQGLTEDLSISSQELEDVLASVNGRVTEVKVEESRDFSQLSLKENEKEGEVTVKEGSQSVKLATDGSGNAVKVVDVVSEEEGSSENKGNAREGNGDRELGSTNSMLNELVKDQTQGVDGAYDQLTAGDTADTQEIMDQILDYMKLQAKPEMDQLEMQLHPESLGTLRVQLTSKGGELTAQFHVQNESVKAVIESQLTILKDTLKEQGVKVEAVEVTVESHEFESNLWQGQERDNSDAYKGSKKTPRRINLDALSDNFEEEADDDELLAAEIMKANGGTVDYTA